MARSPIHDPLEQLVEDVRCDGFVDIRQWKGCPEWVNDRLDSIFFTGSMERAYIAISQSVSRERLSIVTGQECTALPKLITRDLTLGAFTVVRTAHQALFGVVTDEVGQNGMAPAPDPIPTQHWQSSFSMRCDRA